MGTVNAPGAGQAPKTTTTNSFESRLASAGADARQGSGASGAEARSLDLTTRWGGKIAQPRQGDRRARGREGETINGDNRDNLLVGTRGNDTINGGGGNDSIVGGRGDDTIDAGEGNDQVRAGRGDDTVRTGGGFDFVYAGAGNDKVIVEGGAFVNGGRGNDTVVLTGKESDYTRTEVSSGALYQNKNTGDYIGLVSVENVEFSEPQIVFDGPEAIAPPPREEILGSWTLNSISGQPAVPGREPTITFNDDGTVNGSDGVNRFFGTFTYEDGAITFGPIATTRVGTSDPALIEQSQNFARTVLGAEQLRIGTDGNLLTIDQDSGQVANLSPADDGPGTPPADPTRYAGFSVNTSRPDSDVVTVDGRRYSMRFIRDAVRMLNAERPYSGPVTTDFRQTPWGEGSGTGLNLISNYLREIAPPNWRIGPHNDPSLNNPNDYLERIGDRIVRVDHKAPRNPAINDDGAYNYKPSRTVPNPGNYVPWAGTTPRNG